MGILVRIHTAVLLYFFLFTESSTAHILSLKLRSDKRHMIPFSDFEFSNVGYVSFVISSVTVTSTLSRPDPSRIGFILQQYEVRNETRFRLQQNNTICALDFKLNSVLFTFQNLSHYSFNKSFPVTYSGMKSLFFVNCNGESFVTMDGRAELYNVDHGTTRNYLSAGLTELPFLSIIFSCIYISFIGSWILVCLKNRRPFNRTHLLMGGFRLLLVNFLHFMGVAADLLYVKATGTAHGFDVLFCISQLSRAVLLFTVIVLIGAGWFFWKPYLFGEEIMILTVVIVLQVWANVDPIWAWESALPYNIEALSVADFICCIVIFCPITWSICSLLKVCETDLNAYKNAEKLSSFFMLLVVYMVITRVIVIPLSTQWVIYMVKEGSTLVFHMVMFYIFRPVDRMRIKMKTRNDESWVPTISCFDSPV